MSYHSVFLVLLLCLSLPLHLTAADDPENVLDVYCNLTRDPFSGLSDVVLSHFFSYADNPPQVLSRPFLRPKRPDFYGPPEMWIMIHFVENNPGETATLALCADDAYAHGFKSTNSWNHLSEFQPIVPGSYKLPVSHVYPDLLPLLPNRRRSSHRDLYKVRLGKAAAIDAFRILANYNPQTTSVSKLRSALVSLIVMVCEGNRFSGLNAKLRSRWERPSPVYMTRREANLVVQWAAISYTLLWWEQSNRGRWEKKYEKQLVGVNANSPWLASSLVLCLLRPYTGFNLQ
ncbi:hypothetical protein VPH35_071170 [Triticum aestivum]